MSTPTQVRAQRPPGFETYIQKGWRKCKEQPIVPIGVVATCAALIGASFSLRTGNRTQFNRYLRLRVVAQGVTIVGCVVGAWYVGREARMRAMAAQLEEAKSGRIVKKKAFDEGLGERMQEAERLHEIETGIDRRPLPPKS